MTVAGRNPAYNQIFACRPQDRLLFNGTGFIREGPTKSLRRVLLYGGAARRDMRRNIVPSFEKRIALRLRAENATVLVGLNFVWGRRGVPLLLEPWQLFRRSSRDSGPRFGFPTILSKIILKNFYSLCENTL